MSILTANPLLVVPSAANSTTVQAGTPAWTNGSWVQFIASAGADLAIAGVQFRCTSITDVEVDFGVGGAGSEVVFSTLHVVTFSNDGDNPIVMFPIPITGVTSGSRLALRTRSATANATVLLAVFYYSALDSTAVTDKGMACAPSAAAGASITPNGSAWVNSSWVELTSGVAHEISLAGITLTHPVNPSEYEFDLGTGGSGSETVITTVRGAHSTSDGHVSFIHLPAVYPLVANTRVAVRLRKPGTDTTAWKTTLLYYDATTFIPTSISVSVFDAATVAENVTLTKGLRRQVSDAATVAENIATRIVGRLSRAVSDGLTLTEAVTILQAIRLLKAESAAIAESVQTRIIERLHVLCAESVTVAEAVITRVHLAISVHDSLTITDIPLLPLYSSRSDRVRVAEVVYRAFNKLAVHVHDSLTVTESPLYASIHPTTGGTVVNPSPYPTGADFTDYWATGP